MGIMWNFWEWGGSITPSLGYAIIAEGNTTVTFKYDMNFQTVVSAPNFLAGADTGGIFGGNETLGYHFNNNSGASDLADIITWSSETYATNATSIAGTGTNNWSMNANNADTLLAYYGNATAFNGNYKVDLSALTESGISNFTSYNRSIQAGSTPSKGYFHGSSYAYSGDVVTAFDGPAAPTNVGIKGNMRGGTASNGAELLTQCVPTAPPGVFNSQLYNVSGGTTISGPTFSSSFPSTGGNSPGSGAASGTGSAVFFENFGSGPTFPNHTEGYGWSNATVFPSSTIPNMQGDGPSYAPGVANSVPAYL